MDSILERTRQFFHDDYILLAATQITATDIVIYLFRTHYDVLYLRKVKLDIIKEDWWTNINTQLFTVLFSNFRKSERKTLHGVYFNQYNETTAEDYVHFAKMWTLVRENMASFSMRDSS
jgi:hypothetical protein